MVVSDWQQSVKGMPENLLLTDATIHALQSNPWNPGAVLQGAVVAPAGTLGRPGGYQDVRITIMCRTELLRSSKTRSSLTGYVPMGVTMFPTYSDHEERQYDTHERVLAEVMFYQYSRDGPKEPPAGQSQVIVPFEVKWPADIGGMPLPPSISRYVSYRAVFTANYYTETRATDFSIDNLHVVSASTEAPPQAYPAFWMQSPYIPAASSSDAWSCSNVRLRCRLPRGIAAEARSKLLSLGSKSKSKAPDEEPGQWGSVEMNVYIPHAPGVAGGAEVPIILEFTTRAPYGMHAEEVDWGQLLPDLPNQPGAASRSKEDGGGEYYFGNYISATVPVSRGGDGQQRQLPVHKWSNAVSWEPEAFNAGGKVGAKCDAAFALPANGYAWSAPWLDNSESGGVWARRAFVRGRLRIPLRATPTYYFSGDANQSGLRVDSFFSAVPRLKLETEKESFNLRNLRRSGPIVVLDTAQQAGSPASAPSAPIECAQEQTLADEPDDVPPPPYTEM